MVTHLSTVKMRSSPLEKRPSMCTSSESVVHQDFHAAPPKIHTSFQYLVSNGFFRKIFFCNKLHAARRSHSKAAFESIDFNAIFFIMNHSYQEVAFPSTTTCFQCIAAIHNGSSFLHVRSSKRQRIH